MKAFLPQWQCSTTAAQTFLHTSTAFKCSLGPKFPTRFTKPIRISAATVPARDRVMDFGRHKGKMLGTLPSTYLKWVSKNLRARDFEEWAKLADEVLDDPVYRDRIEWEFAEKVLNGDVSTGPARSAGAVSELLEMSERFGWDNDDKVGWSKIDFGLLGTSKGGRIPRVSEDRGAERESRLKSEKARVSDREEARGGEKRRERRERLRMKRGGLNIGAMEKNGNGGFVDDQVTIAGNHDRTVENRSPFPGRESLLKKVLRSRERLS